MSHSHWEQSGSILYSILVVMLVPFLHVIPHNHYLHHLLSAEKKTALSLYCPSVHHLMLHFFSKSATSFYSLPSCCASVCLLSFLSIGLPIPLQSFSKCVTFYPLMPPSIYSSKRFCKSVLWLSRVFLRLYYNHCLLLCNMPCSLTALALHMDHRISNNDSICTEDAGSERVSSSSSHGFCSRKDDDRDTVGWAGLEGVYNQSARAASTVCSHPPFVCQHLTPPLLYFVLLCSCYSNRLRPNGLRLSSM